MLIAESDGGLNLLYRVRLDHHRPLAFDDRTHGFESKIDRCLRIIDSTLNVRFRFPNQGMQRGEPVRSIGVLAVTLRSSSTTATDWIPVTGPLGAQSNITLESHVFPSPTVELHQCRVTGDESAGGTDQREQYAVCTSDRDSFAVGIECYSSANVWIE